jgi:hypothetical protein
MKRLLQTFLLLNLVSAALAQVTAPPAIAKNRKANKTLLWQISGNGLERPSYVYGTMHILCKSDARLSNSLQSILQYCDDIYFEVDMDDMSGMLGMVQHMNMKNGKKLSDLLPKSEYDSVKNYFTRKQKLLPFGMLERMKPLLIGALLAEGNMGCDSVSGVEMKIMEANRRYKKPVKGLESLSYQAQLFDSIPYEDQAKSLYRSITTVNDDNTETRRLMDAYLSQDLKKIEKMLSKSDDLGEGKYNELLLYRRNRNWVAQIPAIASQRSCLFAVGAGHIVGEEGVIALLRKAGYTLTPLVNK